MSAKHKGRVQRCIRNTSQYVVRAFRLKRHSGARPSMVRFDTAPPALSSTTPTYPLSPILLHFLLFPAILRDLPPTRSPTDRPASSQLSFARWQSEAFVSLRAVVLTNAGVTTGGQLYLMDALHP